MILVEHYDFSFWKSSGGWYLLKIRPSLEGDRILIYPVALEK